MSFFHFSESRLDTRDVFSENIHMNPPAPETLITLTSDFGTRDGYAGAMKGVIRSVCPHARIEDITHDIPPGDVRAGAWADWYYGPADLESEDAEDQSGAATLAPDWIQ